MPEASEHGGNAAQEEFKEAGFRFGAVLVLITGVLLFTIAGPDGDVTRAVSVLLTAGMLLTVAIQSQRAYFSVTVLTTTGLGDLPPAMRAGRTLTVLEELIGQLYLVTVVALIVANVGRAPRRPRERPRP
jgi:Ion channel